MHWMFVSIMGAAMEIMKSSKNLLAPDVKQSCTSYMSMMRAMIVVSCVHQMPS